jgi:hypothetical protein
MTIAAAVTALLLPAQEKGMARVTEVTDAQGGPVRTGEEAAR